VTIQEKANDQFTLDFNQVLKVQFQLNPRRQDDKIEFRAFLQHAMGTGNPDDADEEESVYSFALDDIFIRPLKIHTIFFHPHNAVGEGGRSKARFEWDNRFAWWHSKEVDFIVRKLTDNSWKPVWEDFEDAERDGRMAYCGPAGAVPISNASNYPNKIPLDEEEHTKSKEADSTLTIETADSIRQTGRPLLLRPSGLNRAGRDFCQKAQIRHLLPIVSAFECIRGETKRKFVLVDPISYKCGTHGMVVQYVSESADAAVERQFVSVKHAYEVVELLMTMERERGDGLHCGQILCRSMVPNKVSAAIYPPIARRSGSVYMHLVAMPTLTGDLDEFCAHANNPKLSVETISRIVLEVKAQLDCLLKHGVCYMDIKPQNILYALREKNDVQSLRVVLCDVNDNVNDTPISTINCPFSAMPNYPTCTGESKQCQNFNLCMLALQLHMGIATSEEFAAFWVPEDFYERLPRAHILELAQQLRDIVTSKFPLLADLTRGWPDV